MKIERMNEQQIRCTLTKEDLAARKIELSELAYGTDKARSLFREMMTMAADELDFIADDMPLMIEAIPMGRESIVLIVTKVDDPEELDTRFAQFSPSLIDEDDGDIDDYENDFMPIPGYDNVQSAGTFDGKQSFAPKPVAAQLADVRDLVRLFSFDSLANIINLAHVLRGEYDGSNSIYKDSRTGKYLLIIEQSGMELAAYNRLCNIISEYGTSEKNLLATHAFLEEHCELILGGQAIQQISQI